MGFGTQSGPLEFLNWCLWSAPRIWPGCSVFRPLSGCIVQESRTFSIWQRWCVESRLCSRVPSADEPAGVYFSAWSSRVCINCGETQSLSRSRWRTSQYQRKKLVANIWKQHSKQVSFFGVPEITNNVWGGPTKCQWSFDLALHS